jgi:hypothetical protein
LPGEIARVTIKFLNMVKVTGFKEVQKADGTSFITLELTGALELVQSQETGNFYATVRKCRIPSTFKAAIAEMMIGQQIEGEIVKVEVEPYDYVNEETGETLTLHHSWAYRPKGSMETIRYSEPAEELA